MQVDARDIQRSAVLAHIELRHLVWRQCELAERLVAVKKRREVLKNYLVALRELCRSIEQAFPGEDDWDDAEMLVELLDNAKNTHPLGPNDDVPPTDPEEYLMTLPCHEKEVEIPF